MAKSLRPEQVSQAGRRFCRTRPTLRGGCSDASTGSTPRADNPELVKTYKGRVGFIATTERCSNAKGDPFPDDDHAFESAPTLRQPLRVALLGPRDRATALRPAPTWIGPWRPRQRSGRFPSARHPDRPHQRAGHDHSTSSPWGVGQTRVGCDERQSRDVQTFAGGLHGPWSGPHPGADAGGSRRRPATAQATARTLQSRCATRWSAHGRARRRSKIGTLWRGGPPKLASVIRLSFVKLQDAAWPRAVGNGRTTSGTGVHARMAGAIGAGTTLGCSPAQKTLAAQIDDPRDLVRPRAEDPSDVQMRTRAIQDCSAARPGPQQGTGSQAPPGAPRVPTSISAVGGNWMRGSLDLGPDSLKARLTRHDPKRRHIAPDPAHLAAGVLRDQRTSPADRQRGRVDDRRMSPRARQGEHGRRRRPPSKPIARNGTDTERDRHRKRRGDAVRTGRASSTRWRSSATPGPRSW